MKDFRVLALDDLQTTVAIFRFYGIYIYMLVIILTFFQLHTRPNRYWSILILTFPAFVLHVAIILAALLGFNANEEASASFFSPMRIVNIFIVPIAATLILVPVNWVPFGIFLIVGPLMLFRHADSNARSEFKCRIFGVTIFVIIATHTAALIWLNAADWK